MIDWDCLIFFIQGCLWYSDYEKSYEEQLGENFYPQHTYIGKYQRAANGLNYSLSLLGSIMYLIGSITFLPVLDAAGYSISSLYSWELNCLCFSMWKLWRIGSRNNAIEPCGCAFRLSNFHNHWANFWVKLMTGLGGLAYLVGSIYFLPEVDTTKFITEVAVFWFVIGSVFYIIAAACLCCECCYMMKKPQSQKYSVANSRSNPHFDISYVVVVNPLNVV